MLKIILFYGDGIDPKNEGEGVQMEDSKMEEWWRMEMDDPKNGW